MGKRNNRPSANRGHLVKRYLTLLIIIAGLTFTIDPGATVGVQSGVKDGVNPETKKTVVPKAVKLQLPFIENQGQVRDQSVLFYAEIFGGTSFVTDKGEVIYSFYDVNKPKKGSKSLSTPQKAKGWTLKEKLLGATLKPPQGIERAKTRVSYFIGNDKNKWKSNIPTYNVVSLGEVYKGINLSLEASGKTFEKIFTVKPGADPKNIRIKIEGVNKLHVNKNGELLIQNAPNHIRFSKPIAYQLRNKKKEFVEINYLLFENRYGFRIGNYDRSLALIIDPVLSYSTLLGGTNLEEGHGLVVDSSGNAFVTGYTHSTASQFGEAAIGENQGGSDAFVAQVSADGSTLNFFTFIGGIDNDYANDLILDASGNAILVGETASDDFPTQGAPPDGQPYQGTYQGGDADAFAAVIGSDGTLIYSSYLGGDGYDSATSIFIDSDSHAWVAGTTESTDFPIAGNYIANGLSGPQDAFVLQFEDGGSDLLYSSYLGGTGDEEAKGIAIDDQGFVHVTGYTTSADFPTQGAAPPDVLPYQSTYQGAGDAFITKIDPGLGLLSYSTYLGGNGLDIANAIVLDNAGNAYITGESESTADFPLSIGAYQSTNAGTSDAFVSILSAESLSIPPINVKKFSVDPSADTWATKASEPPWFSPIAASPN